MLGCKNYGFLLSDWLERNITINQKFQSYIIFHYMLMQKLLICHYSPVFSLAKICTFGTVEIIQSFCFPLMPFGDHPHVSMNISISQVKFSVKWYR